MAANIKYSAVLAMTLMAAEMVTRHIIYVGMYAALKMRRHEEK